jgi:hypothetical protein
MIAALALAAYTGAVVGVTYYVITEHQRRRQISAAARLAAWERIARRHAVVRADLEQVQR